YKGKAPYMIILLDGRKRDDLLSFSPTLASAAVLQKFYGPDSTTSELTSTLQEAMQLYNDAGYRAKGEKLKKQLKGLDKTSGDYEKLKALYEAYSMNIENETLKLPPLK